MISFYLFTLSGAALITLTLAKRVEEKRKKPFFLLKAISKGDKHARVLHHRLVHFYSIGKEKAGFFIKKRLPMHSRNSFNKFIAGLSEQAERHFGNIRDSRLLKKSDGISEFFKNMSSVEKGSGEINEAYEEREEVEVIQVKIEPIAPVVATVHTPAPRKPRKVKPVQEAKPMLATVMPTPMLVKRVRKAPAKKVVKLVVREEVEY